MHVNRVLNRSGGLIRRLGRDGIVDVGDADDLRQQRDVVSSQAIGIACAVQTLVMVSNNRPDGLQGSQVPTEFVTDDRVRRATMTVTGQPTVSYGYDDANRLTSVTQGTSTVTITYDDADRRRTLTLPNGIVTTYDYDNANQLTGLTYTLGATTLGTLTYTYDLAGRRTEVGGTWARTGLPQAVTSASYDAANRMTQWAGQIFGHDPNGNLASDGLTSYAWDARNQLVGLSGASSASFTYDGSRRRTFKTIGGSSTQFLFDGPRVVQEMSGGVSADRLLGVGVDEAWSRSDASGTRLTLADAQGSTLARATMDGIVDVQLTYEPFGGTVLTGSASTDSFQYTGRERDAGDLYFYRARFYNTAIQRFTSEDPIGFADGPNLYSYVADSPLNAIDPFSLCSCSDPCPSGQWLLDTYGVTTPGLGLVLSGGWGVLTCKGRPSVKRRAVITCYSWGMFGIGQVGFSLHFRGTAVAGACRPEDLKPFDTAAWTLSGPTTSTDGDSLGIGFGLVLGFGRVHCNVLPF